MKQVKVSVVIPVYNVAPYLPKCVASVQEQTLREIEIILVDDGSTDESGKICDEFAAQDERIRVLHKPNGGLADARNAGTAVANGAFICYVDSDDWIAAELVETLLQAIENLNAQVAVCNLVTAMREDFSFPAGKESPEWLTGPDAMEKMLYQTLFDTSACGKLYQTELIRRFPFPQGRLYEDLFTVYKVLFEADAVAFVPREMYAYRQNPQSIMNQRFTPRMFDELDAADEIVEFVRENCPQYLPAANARRFSSYSQVLRWMRNADGENSEICDKQKTTWHFLKEYRLKMLWDKKARPKNRFAAACTFLGRKIYSRI